MLRWIQMLYDERYPDQPALSLSEIRALFPLEFRKGLRLDVNRPSVMGLMMTPMEWLDEPSELITTQNELFPNAASVVGTYFDEFNPPSAVNSPDAAIYNRFIAPLQSRKMFARQLYCLAQLLIARDYPFNGITPATNANLYLRVRARELAQWAVNVV